MQEAETYKLDWQGRKIEISYQPRSFAGTAHLQIRAKHARPLPITETGYRSHFVSPADVEHLGGPVAYVGFTPRSTLHTSRHFHGLLTSPLQFNKHLERSNPTRKDSEVCTGCLPRQDIADE